jgi:hypothetical protein
VFLSLIALRIAYKYRTHLNLSILQWRADLCYLRKMPFFMWIYHLT